MYYTIHANLHIVITQPSVVGSGRAHVQSKMARVYIDILYWKINTCYDIVNLSSYSYRCRQIQHRGIKDVNIKKKKIIDQLLHLAWCGYQHPSPVIARQNLQMIGEAEPAWESSTEWQTKTKISDDGPNIAKMNQGVRNGMTKGEVR